MWDRKDAAAVAVIEDCVVGLPAGLFSAARCRPEMTPAAASRPQSKQFCPLVRRTGRPQPSKEIHMFAQLEITDEVAV